MTPTQAVAFVNRVAEIWYREPLAPGTPDAWYAAGLKDVSPTDAAEVLVNLPKVLKFISLAEILTEVRRIRELRLARRPIHDPPHELTDDERAYRERIKAETRRIADGLAIGRALEVGKGHQPSAEYNQVRGIHRDPIRVASKRVRCPWETCKAPIGSTCTTANGRPLDRPAHDARLVAAGVADWVEVNGVQRAVIRQQDVA